MKQWKFNLLVSVPLISLGLTLMRCIRTNERIWQLASMMPFILGFYAVVSGLYYYAYYKKREFGA
jgi:hypothetical protein